MRSHIVRTFGLAAAALLVATSAQAQGKSQGKGKSGEAKVAKTAKANGKGNDDNRRADGVLIPNDGRVGNGKKVPPGLAKKPGQMPPGQYKKRYGVTDGSSVLGDIMRQRGYSVLRVVPAGESRYVYYRLPDGSERRAVVSPGTDRLVFRNVPATLLQEVLARLY